MKLNIGSGEHPAQGWVNTDRNPDHQPDVVWDIRNHMPNHLHSLKRVYCGHVLEHIPLNRVIETLRYIRMRMAPDGRICVVGPDYIRAQQEGFDQDVLDGIVLGPSADDPHLWICNAPAVILALQGAGYRNVTPHPIEALSAVWPVVSRVGWQCAVTAVA